MHAPASFNTTLLTSAYIQYLLVFTVPDGVVLWIKLLPEVRHRFFLIII